MELKKEVEEEIDQAHRIGVRAVPTFVFEGEHVIQGAQPVSEFVAMLEEAKMAPAAAERPEESCADGSCAVIA